MSAIEFIFYCNFLNFFFILFLFVFSLFVKNFSRRLNRFFMISILLVFLLTLTDSISMYYRTFPEVHYIRIVASTLGYIIRPCCAAMFLLMCINNTKKNYIILHTIIGLNALIVMFNFWFPVVFYLDETNGFHRAFLWFVPYISSFGILAALITSATMQIHLNKRKAVFTYALFLSIAAGTLAEAFNLARFALPTSGIICIFFYFLHMNTDLYKRDTLTKLYKRENFDQDIIKFSRKKMVIATMDLNDLKKWNDIHGHSEGDRALLTSVEGMKKNFEEIAVLYRTGGDEFMAIFPNMTVSELNQNIQGFKDYMSNTRYRVAFGCADFTPGDNLEEVIKFSDQRMYENKQKLKETPTVF